MLPSPPDGDLSLLSERGSMLHQLLSALLRHLGDGNFNLRPGDRGVQVKPRSSDRLVHHGHDVGVEDIDQQGPGVRGRDLRNGNELYLGIVVCLHSHLVEDPRISPSCLDDSKLLVVVIHDGVKPLLHLPHQVGDVHLLHLLLLFRCRLALLGLLREAAVTEVSIMLQSHPADDRADHASPCMRDRCSASLQPHEGHSPSRHPLAARHH
mmetsp:Transcript_27260/g.89026  ORF Transcript_27260/g.89026 Transcript_27260/m.89026 type:complete len:209 (-) Transcript_27260:117-743(-)